MSKANKKIKLEEALKRLEQIVDAMESGETGIDEMIADYEEGMRLVAHCRKTLDQAEQRIRVIQAGAAGEIEAIPFEPSADEAEADPTPRE